MAHTHITAAHRHSLPASDFADPAHEKYPVDTKKRARNALSRGAQFASPALKAKIRAKVHQKYPSISIGKMHGGEVHHRMDKKRRGGSCKG